MKLDEVQSQLVTLMTAAFPGQTVVADLFRKATEKQMEDALSTSGFCISVSPLLTVTPINGEGGRSMSMRAMHMVRIRTNPDISEVEPIGAIRTACTAAKNYTSNARRFSIDEIKFAVDDSGCLSWDISVTYAVQL